MWIWKAQFASKCSKSILSDSTNQRGAHHLLSILKRALQVAAVESGDLLCCQFEFSYIGTERFCGFEVNRFKSLSLLTDFVVSLPSPLSAGLQGEPACSVLPGWECHWPWCHSSRWCPCLVLWKVSLPVLCVCVHEWMCVRISACVRACVCACVCACVWLQCFVRCYSNSHWW